MAKFTRLILVSTIAATISTTAANAQALSAGILGGANFNDIVTSVSTANYGTVVNSSNFSIGPSVRVNLPASFRLEFDALYRPYAFNFSTKPSSYSVSGEQWRFPVLLQYRLGGPPLIKPFVEAGISFDHLAGISAAAKSVITSGPGALLHTTDTGFVIGAGVDVKVPFIKLSGELRYTRATVSDFASISNLNQAEVLFGIRF